MTEYPEPNSGKNHAETPDPAVEGEDGQYATGDYGDAGALDGVAATKEPGEYADADYGDAGTANDIRTPKTSGAYAEGDYGGAGTVDAGADGTRSGGYAEGDYGDAGRANEELNASDRPKGVGEDHDAVPGRTDDGSEG